MVRYLQRWPGKTRKESLNLKENCLHSSGKPHTKRARAVFCTWQVSKAQKVMRVGKCGWIRRCWGRVNMIKIHYRSLKELIKWEGETCLLLTTCSVWLHGGGDCVTSTQSECSGWMLIPERLTPCPLGYLISCVLSSPWQSPSQFPSLTSFCSHPVSKSQGSKAQPKVFSPRTTLSPTRVHPPHSSEIHFSYLTIHNRILLASVMN